MSRNLNTDIGLLGGSCNNVKCQRRPAIHFDDDTSAHYCARCAPKKQTQTTDTMTEAVDYWLESYSIAKSTDNEYLDALKSFIDAGIKMVYPVELAKAIAYNRGFRFDFQDRIINID